MAFEEKARLDRPNKVDAAVDDRADQKRLRGGPDSFMPAKRDTVGVKLLPLVRNEPREKRFEQNRVSQEDRTIRLCDDQ